MGEAVIPVNGLKLDGSNNWFSLKDSKEYKKVKKISGGKEVSGYRELTNILYLFRNLIAICYCSSW
jgi:hypothetical protein